MAAADVTIGDDGGEFETGASPFTATLTTAGRRLVRNTSSAQAIVITPFGGTPNTTQPSGAANWRLIAGATCRLPLTCKSFGFASSAQGFFQVED